MSQAWGQSYKGELTNLGHSILIPQGIFPFPTNCVNPSGTGGQPSVELISGFPSELFKEALSIANMIFLNIVQTAG